MRRKGYHEFSFKSFCPTVPKNFVGGTIRCKENFGYRKVFLHEKEISRFSVEVFLSHSTEKFRGGTILQYFRKLRVSKIFIHRRGGHHGIVEKSFVTQDRNLVREPSCFPEHFWYRKNFTGKRGGGGW